MELDSKRQEIFYSALLQLRANEELDLSTTGLPSAGQVELSSETGLPVRLRLKLAEPLQVRDDYDQKSPPIWKLLTPLQSAALFGLEPTEPQELIEQELVSGPSVRQAGPPTLKELQIYHFTWHQFYKGYPCIGGRVHLYAEVGNNWALVTSSYLPLPPDYTIPDEASLEARLEDAKRLARMALGEAIQVSQAQIRGQDYAILPFAGVYHLVSRFLVVVDEYTSWFVEVDMERGEVVGQPWQPAAFAHYYKDSAEAAAGGGPTGDIAALRAQLSNWESDLNALITPSGATPFVEAMSASSRVEDTTVGAYALILYHHLRTAGGLEHARFSHLNTTQLRIQIATGLSTGFDYRFPTTPSISFTLDDGQGIAVENRRYYHPARDPEVVLHEMVHGFLWGIDAALWETPTTLSPFGRALQEGYAMYLSRSVAAGNNQHEARETWARAAYPSHALEIGLRGWEDRWLFARTKKEPGADLLLRPYTYPATIAVDDSLDVYDVSMVWARALWDLRQLVDQELADWLAVNAYLQLQGRVTDFDLATRAVGGANQGVQLLWAGRGLATGQGICGFARSSDGAALLAAGDMGILRYDEANLNWQLELLSSDKPTLIGVAAIVAAGNTFYAAVTKSIIDLDDPAASHTPGVYQKSAEAAVSAAWQPLSNLPAGVLPLNLLIDNGTLWVGTNRGVYALSQETSSWIEGRT